MSKPIISGCEGIDGERRHHLRGEESQGDVMPAATNVADAKAIGAIPDRLALGEPQKLAADRLTAGVDDDGERVADRRVVTRFGLELDLQGAVKRDTPKDDDLTVVDAGLKALYLLDQAAGNGLRVALECRRRIHRVSRRLVRGDDLDRRRVGTCVSARGARGLVIAAAKDQVPTLDVDNAVVIKPHLQERVAVVAGLLEQSLVVKNLATVVGCSERAVGLVVKRRTGGIGK